jgi:hypothetical protein|tara:strand:- start:590 stop:856 length:267 start_codon:yes stop_codon:yes gene_type:complete
MNKYIEKFTGQPVAVMAARYQYRGTVSEVGSNYIVLANAFAVEVSGRSSAERPETEDPINGSICISLDAVEIIYQPNWCFADENNTQN